MPKAAPQAPTSQCAMFCYLRRVENGDSCKFSTGIQGGTGIGTVHTETPRHGRPVLFSAATPQGYSLFLCPHSFAHPRSRRTRPAPRNPPPVLDPSVTGLATASCHAPESGQRNGGRGFPCLHSHV